MKWQVLRDRTGHPWLQGDGMTIAKVWVHGVVRFELFHGQRFVRVVSVEEVQAARSGEWDPAISRESNQQSAEVAP